MRALRGRYLLLPALLVLGIMGAGASATPPSGFSAEPLGRGKLAESVRSNIKVGGSRIAVKTRGPWDIVNSRITIAPGGTSGWHAHPGPNFNVVTQGTITLYQETAVERDDDDDDDEDEGDEERTGCSSQSFGPGTSWFGPGFENHVARNEGSVPAVVVATFVVPVGEGTRIDAPKPADCPVQ